MQLMSEIFWKTKMFLREQCQSYKEHDEFICLFVWTLHTLNLVRPGFISFDANGRLTPICEYRPCSSECDNTCPAHCINVFQYYPIKSNI